MQKYQGTCLNVSIKSNILRIVLKKTLIYLFLQILSSNMSSRKDSERKEEAEIRATTTSAANTSPPISQQEIRQAITKALDEAKDNTKRAVDQAKREIPHYTQIANDYQEQAIQAVREMVDNYIDTQKEIINSFQKSSWFPYIENTYGMHYWTTTFLSPRRMTEIYANMVSSFADNIVSATRLANNMIFANMETFTNAMLYTKNSLEDMSKVGVNATKIFEQI